MKILYIVKIEQMIPSPVKGLGLFKKSFLNLYANFSVVCTKINQLVPRFLHAGTRDHDPEYSG
jgi:hypothetical protein